MPYRLEYFDSPQNMHLKVYHELPDGYVKNPNIDFEAWLQPEYYWMGRPIVLHYCEHCKGWVEGMFARLLCKEGEKCCCRRCGRTLYIKGRIDEQSK